MRSAYPPRHRCTRQREHVVGQCGVPRDPAGHHCARTSRFPGAARPASAAGHRRSHRLRRDESGGAPGDGDVLVSPTVIYAASGEHQSFAGTSSIGSDALHQLLVELVRSMRTWCGRVVFVNAHGGNMTALGRAIGQLLAEGHDVGWAPCKTEEVDAHAGVTETSLMLHLRPSDVRMEFAEAGNTAPILELLPDLMAGGIAAVSANGVLGDPVGASAAQGATLLEAMARQVAGWMRDGVADARGMLGEARHDE